MHFHQYGWFFCGWEMRLGITNINSDVLSGKSLSLAFRIYFGFSQLSDVAAVTTDRKHEKNWKNVWESLRCQTFLDRNSRLVGSWQKLKYYSESSRKNSGRKFLQILFFGPSGRRKWPISVLPRLTHWISSKFKGGGQNWFYRNFGKTAPFLTIL